MGDDPNQLPKPKRRRWPWVVLGLVLVLAIALGGARYRLHRRVVTELAKLRAAGYPTTLAELDAWYPMPSGANAADVYMEAFDTCVEDEELEALLPGFSTGPDWPAPGEPLPAEMLAAIDAYLAKNAEALALLAAAATIPECRYPVDLSAGYAVVLPHIGFLGWGPQLLALQAVVQVQRGEHNQSVDSALAILAAAGSVHGEPKLISHLVGLRGTRSAVRAVEQILGRGSLTDRQLARLSEAFVDAIDRAGIPRAMVGERACWLGTFDAVVAEHSGAIFRRAAGLSDAERLAYLALMDEMIKKAEDPSGHTVDIDAMVAALPPYCLIADISVSGVNPALRTELHTDAAVQTLLVGLAAKRYQLAHGKLPEDLDDLAPEYLDAVPIDPCDGEPLRYRRSETGVRIYSVGPDGFDDDGREEPVKGRHHPDGTDIVFTIRR